MAIDVTGLIIILLFFIRGFSRGLIVSLFSFIGILLGILVALKLSSSLAVWTLAHGYTTATWAPMLSYIVLFVGVVILVRITARIVQKMAEGLMLGMVNRLAGGLLFCLLGLVVWSSILWLASAMRMITPEQVALSHTYGWMSKIAPKFFSMSGHLIPGLKTVFGDLGHYFSASNGNNAK